MKVHRSYVNGTDSCRTVPGSANFESTKTKVYILAMHPSLQVIQAIETSALQFPGQLLYIQRCFLEDPTFVKGKAAEEFSI